MATEPLAQARTRFAERDHEILLTEVVKENAEEGEVVEGEGATAREYHPWISRLGGRKFAIAALAMFLLTGLVIYLTWRYDPLDERVTQLLDTYGKWLVGIVGLFVTGNAARFLPGLFGRNGDSK